MRFRAADEECAVASTLLAQPLGGAEDRHLKERAIFGFFANAISAVESCCFANYHLGRMTQSTQDFRPIHCRRMANGRGMTTTVRTTGLRW
jgi:hypothetical protein